MNRKKDKSLAGFTIIELVVAIAIIAVLATIVSANVLNYIDKSKNAAIKSNMANLFTYGATYYIDNDSYNNFCSDADTDVFLDEINEIADPNLITCTCDTGNSCNNAEAWCTVVKLKGSLTSSGNYFCTDSTGKKKESDANPSLSCSGGFCH
jgi:prepilin-type N-terminal cleavage/methylation domain-containing protein